MKSVSGRSKSLLYVSVLIFTAIFWAFRLGLHFPQSTPDLCKDPDIICAPNLSPQIRAQMAEMQREPVSEEAQQEELETKFTDLTGEAKFVTGLASSKTLQGLDQLRLSAPTENRVQVHLIVGNRVVAAFIGQPKVRYFNSHLTFIKANGQEVRWSRYGVLNQNYPVFVGGAENYIE